VSPGGIVALCASVVSIVGGLAHVVRMAYRLVRTLTTTVEAVAQLTHVISQHLGAHSADKPGVDREDFDALAAAVAQLQLDVRDLQTMFRPSSAFRHHHHVTPAPRFAAEDGEPAEESG
jgi:hypothetical protein